MIAAIRRRPLRIILALTAAAALLLIAFPASAAIVPDACRIKAVQADITAGRPFGCTVCHLGVMLINLTNFFIFTIALPVTALLVAIGGIVLLTAGPSEKMRTLGKTILTRTVVGAVIVLVAWLAVDTLIKVLTNGKDALSELGTPWNEVPVERCFDKMAVGNSGGGGSNGSGGG
ncbi:MAG: hypothetical protein A3A44_00385 [Candidatus Sungbacteria bacterium RIFCSPLOWO2_01_FULL_60_25]|uniref:DUF2752 domain-containing protein n=1 Tax=Candidatus Sungbacteria bacterium RIFCSPLOWO2_01_FULL_60_25 TaxID=1802281 RepID=A0A1G2LEN8_9BACT|nr:MAG: hypothetical protein A3A44_00385 [Candidatus Sungbacteria bacterium RIFCSPLOWO2_01_FULL_60_25]